MPWVLRPIMNKGLNSAEDIMKSMGIKKFEELLVDGTGTTKEQWQSAVEDAEKHMDKIIDEIWEE